MRHRDHPPVDKFGNVNIEMVGIAVARYQIIDDSDNITDTRRNLMRCQFQSGTGRDVEMTCSISARRMSWRRK